MTVKHIRARDQQRVQDFQDKGAIPWKSSWKKTGKHSSFNDQKLKPIYLSIIPTLTLKST